MKNATLTLLLGLLGGAVAALLVYALYGAGGAGVSGTGEMRPCAADEDLGARVARLEAARALLDAWPGPRLEGRAPAPGDASSGGAALPPATEAALIARLQPHIERAVEKKLEEIDRRKKEAEEAAARTSKPIPLAEAAAKIGLSAGEEDDVRQIYRDAEEKFLGLLAGENGDPAAVRADLERAAEDKSQRPAIMAKYLPRVMPKLSEVFAIETEKQTRILEAIGKEKAERLAGQNVIEARPFGLGGEIAP
ncbi:MAG: hypothetical protein ACC662_08425, partial [Planctomycetota bacterium]